MNRPAPKTVRRGFLVALGHAIHVTWPVLSAILAIQVALPTALSKPRPPAYTRYSPETWLATHFLTNLTARAKKKCNGRCAAACLWMAHIVPRSLLVVVTPMGGAVHGRRGQRCFAPIEAISAAPSAVSAHRSPRASSFARKKTKMIFEPLPESHTKFISICSDGASPNSTALIVRGPTPLVSQICEASSGREYEHTGRAGARADGPRRIWSRC
jgi:hypothetical protein